MRRILWRIELEIKTFIANILYRLGVKYRVSSGICGSITYGYGKLDPNGYWEYQISVKID